jgi:hypothetical protein
VKGRVRRFRHDARRFSRCCLHVDRVPPGAQPRGCVLRRGDDVLALAHTITRLGIDSGSRPSRRRCSAALASGRGHDGHEHLGGRDRQWAMIAAEINETVGGGGTINLPPGSLSSTGVGRWPGAAKCVYRSSTSTQIEALSQPRAQAPRTIVAAVQTGWVKQHNEDGGNPVVVAESLTSPVVRSQSRLIGSRM